MSFRHGQPTDVFVWTGDPDCQAAHDWLLTWLQDHVAFIAPPAAGAFQINQRILGNLGETVSMCIGLSLRPPAERCFAVNAHQPLSDISRPDVDLLWLTFGEDSRDDFAFIQEVKTTGQANLAYANTLLDDYAKLFGPDPQVTLHTRLQGIQTTLDIQHLRSDLADRVSRLAAKSPRSCRSAVRLLPTLVHDRGCQANPRTKMLAIAGTLTTRGWENVEPWAIGLTDMVDRFGRLAVGQP